MSHPVTKYASGLGESSVGIYSFGTLFVAVELETDVKIITFPMDSLHRTVFSTDTVASN